MAQAAVEAAGVGDEREFAVLVRKDGAIVAGASGAMWGGGCQLHVVWVDKTLRNGGIGRALMAEVEREARLRGCRLVMGLTYDVLIGDFYDRLGYRTIGLARGLSGWDDNALVLQGSVAASARVRSVTSLVARGVRVLH